MRPQNIPPINKVKKKVIQLGNVLNITHKEEI